MCVEEKSICCLHYLHTLHTHHQNADDTKNRINNLLNYSSYISNTNNYKAANENAKLVVHHLLRQIHFVQFTYIDPCKVHLRTNYTAILTLPLLWSLWFIDLRRDDDTQHKTTAFKKLLTLNLNELLSQNSTCAHTMCECEPISHI